MGRGHRGTDTCYNRSELEPENVVLSRGVLSVFVCFVFDVTRVAFLIKQGIFRFKNRHKPIAISGLLTTRACGRTTGLMDPLANRD